MVRYVGVPLLVIVTILGGAVLVRGNAAPFAPVATAQTATQSASSAPFAAITVVGTGTASGAPDIAHLTAGVETQSATAKQASDGNSTTMAAVIAAARGQGIAGKDIQTSNFSINPVYSQPRDNTTTPSIVAYRVNNTVEITVRDVGAVAKVLDAVVQAGANSNVSIRFGMKDPTALQQQALTAAVQQAAAKAGTIAQATGVKLSGMYSVGEQATGGPMPVVARAAAAGAGAAAVPVEEGQLTVTATVTVTYTYTR